MENEKMPFVNRALCAYTPVRSLSSSAPPQRSNAASITKEVYTCTGGSIVVDHDHCYGGKAHGDVNLHTALRSSCNRYFIQLTQARRGKDFKYGGKARLWYICFSLADNLKRRRLAFNAQARRKTPVRWRCFFRSARVETTVSPLNLAAA